MKNKKIKYPTILIVDDIPKNIQVVANFLKPEGYHLAFAQNGKNAIAQAKSHKIDLILLDVMMPEMDGFEVCEILKKDPSTANIPVIFLTGKTDIEHVVHGFETGAVDYITKPFNHSELLARVKTHLSLKHAQEKIRNLYEQLDEELDIASEIQKATMREKAEVPFLSIDLIFNPHGKISGDMVDFSKSDNELFVFVGDATGHGIPAALLTMMVPFILDNKSKDDHTNDVITKINDVIANRGISDKFITGIYVKIHSDGKVFACNAGHPPMIIIPVNGTSPILSKPTGMPLGILPSNMAIPYIEKSFSLEPGDKLFLFSDGILEWQNPKNELFGIKRLKKYLWNNKDLDIKTILSGLQKEIEEFSEENSCDDDVTLLGLEYLGM